MKEAMIILRPKMYFKTKEALDKAGFHSMTVREVVGRGKTPVKYDFDTDNVIRHRFVAKTAVTMYVNEEDVDLLIDTVVAVNRTNHAGDGKIFIMPVDDAIRIRTEETGTEAIN